MNKLTMAALALAAIGFASTSASAQVSVNAGANDLILGFQLSGVNTDFEVDLGSYSLFTTTSTLTFNLSTSDLNALSSSWASNTAGTGVQWSVAGALASANNFYATSTSHPNTGSGSALSGPYGLIESLPDGLNQDTGFGVAGATPKSALVGNGTNTAATISDSYTSLEGGAGATPYNSANLVNAEQTGTGTDELYSFVPARGTAGPAVDLGTFSLSSNGTFTYNGIDAAAVPEPSAYALGICAALLFLVLKRRHSVA